jgi:hypothetical protein
MNALLDININIPKNNPMKLIKLLTILLIMTSCVQETHLKTITFKLDMNGIENVSEVGIRGSFTSNPWEKTIFFSDEDNDGIYEGTLSQKTAHSRVEFKFVNQNDQFELQDQNNRSIEFEYKPEIIIYEGVFNDTKKINITKKD